MMLLRRMTCPMVLPVYHRFLPPRWLRPVWAALLRTEEGCAQSAAVKISNSRGSQPKPPTRMKAHVGDFPFVDMAPFWLFVRICS